MTCVIVGEVHWPQPNYPLEKSVPPGTHAQNTNKMSILINLAIIVDKNSYKRISRSSQTLYIYILLSKRLKSVEIEHPSTKIGHFYYQIGCISGFSRSDVWPSWPLIQPRQRQYSRDNVPRWLNRKVITCANKLWPVVVVWGQ
jgi:hypothetical protein